MSQTQRSKQFVTNTSWQTIYRIVMCTMLRRNILQHVLRLRLFVILLTGNSNIALVTICIKHSFPNNLSQADIFKQFVQAQLSKYFFSGTAFSQVPNSAIQIICPTHTIKMLIVISTGPGQSSAFPRFSLGFMCFLNLIRV